MICCTFRPLFSRVKEEKEEKEEGTEVALAGKDGTMPGAMEFVISRLAD